MFIKLWINALKSVDIILFCLFIFYFRFYFILDSTLCLGLFFLYSILFYFLFFSLLFLLQHSSYAHVTINVSGSKEERKKETLLLSLFILPWGCCDSVSHLEGTVVGNDAKPFFIAHMKLKLLIKILCHLSAQCLLWAALLFDCLCQYRLATQHPWPGRAQLSLPDPALVSLQDYIWVPSKFQHLPSIDLMASPVLSASFFITSFSP